VSDTAHDLGTALLRALREAAPANDNSPAPAWVTLAREAGRRGMSTSAMRAWCHRHKVTIREASHKDAWVSPADVDRAIEGLPPAKRPTQETDDVDEAIDARGARR
jgi:hypothetical protein